MRTFSRLGALEWLCDTDLATLDAQAELVSGVRTTTRFSDLLDTDVQALVIAAPAALHYTYTRAALSAGKDVFVEKPMALRCSEGLELVELADSLNRVLMVGHILQYHPAIVGLHGLVAREELGQLRYIYSNRLNLGRVRQEENILWSFAPHDLSVIISLVGSEPEYVSATGSSYLQAGIADVTVTNLRFANDVASHIFVSWLHPYKEQLLVLVGERKMAVFNDGLPTGKVRIHDKGIDWQNGLPVPRRNAETVLEVDSAEPLLLECQHFLECVTRRVRPRTDGASALSVLRVLEASQMSMDSGGRPVSLADFSAKAHI